MSKVTPLINNGAEPTQSGFRVHGLNHDAIRRKGKVRIRLRASDRVRVRNRTETTDSEAYTKGEGGRQQSIESDNLVEFCTSPQTTLNSLRLPFSCLYHGVNNHSWSHGREQIIWVMPVAQC